MLTLSRLWSVLYRNHSIDLFCKSMDWFLYDRDLHPERDQVLIFPQFFIFHLLCRGFEFVMFTVSCEHGRENQENCVVFVHFYTKDPLSQYYKDTTLPHSPSKLSIFYPVIKLCFRYFSSGICRNRSCVSAD